MDLRILLFMAGISVMFTVCRTMNVPVGHSKGDRPLHQVYHTDEKIANFAQPYPLQQEDFEQNSGMLFAISSDISPQFKTLQQSEMDIRSQLQKEVEEIEKRMAFSDIRPKVKSSGDVLLGKGSKHSDQEGTTDKSLSPEEDGALPQSLTPFFMGQCILCSSDPQGQPGPPGAAGPQGLPGTLGKVRPDGQDLTLGPKGDDGSTEGISSLR